MLPIEISNDDDDDGAAPPGETTTFAFQESGSLFSSSSSSSSSAPSRRRRRQYHWYSSCTNLWRTTTRTATTTTIPHFYHQQNTTNTKQLWWELGYCILFCAVGHIILAIHHLFIDSHQRPIPYQHLAESNTYVRNLVYNEQNNGETISGLGVVLLALIPIGIQLVLIGFAGTTSSTTTTDSYYYYHHNNNHHYHPNDDNNKRKMIVEMIQKSLCTYAVAITINNVLTGIFKNYVGYLRPIFFWACNPTDDYSDCKRKQMHHYRTSFPSGHSSFSFCIWVLLSLFLEQHYGISSIQRFQIVNNINGGCGGERSSIFCVTATTTHHPLAWYKLYSLLAAMLPVGLIAVWIGCSRIVDNWHFPADVLAGAFLGSSVALATYRIWFPNPRMKEMVVGPL